MAKTKATKRRRLKKTKTEEEEVRRKSRLLSARPSEARADQRRQTRPEADQAKETNRLAPRLMDRRPTHVGIWGSGGLSAEVLMAPANQTIIMVTATHTHTPALHNACVNNTHAHTHARTHYTHTHTHRHTHTHTHNTHHHHHNNNIDNYTQCRTTLTKRLGVVGRGKGGGEDGVGVGEVGA